MSVWRRAGREPREMIEEWHAGLQRIASLRGDRVEMRVNRYWIAFRSDRQRRAFAELRPNRRRVEVFILPERRHLADVAGLAKTAPRTQGWNWFRTKFYVIGNGQGRAALSLLRQSYESASPPKTRRRTKGGGHQLRFDVAAR